ncbi:unnamed protein product, partial [Polarella glacialis]
MAALGFKRGRKPSEAAVLSKAAASMGFSELPESVRPTAQRAEQLAKEAGEAVLVAIAMKASYHDEYLAKFGFEASSATEWSVRHLARVQAGSQPMLEIAVAAEEEADGHCYYVLQCAVWRPSEEFCRSEWCSRRR